MLDKLSARITRRMVVTCGVLGGNFLAAIEATIVAAAMPTVVTQLGGLTQYSWYSRRTFWERQLRCRCGASFLTFTVDDSSIWGL